LKRITARLTVLAAGLAVPAAIATSALADGVPSVPQSTFAPQTATQTNTNTQTAKCEAQSDQWAPSTNTSGETQKSENSGNVTQAPQSNPTCNATNNNTTTQAISQEQQKKEEQQQPQQEEEQQQQKPQEQQDPSAG
jgi:hypothetical protein